MACRGNAPSTASAPQSSSSSESAPARVARGCRPSELPQKYTCSLCACGGIRNSSRNVASGSLASCASAQASAVIECAGARLHRQCGFSALHEVGAALVRRRRSRRRWLRRASAASSGRAGTVAVEIKGLAIFVARLAVHGVVAQDGGIDAFGCVARNPATAWPCRSPRLTCCWKNVDESCISFAFDRDLARFRRCRRSAGSLTWNAMNCGLPSFFSMITLPVRRRLELDDVLEQRVVRWFAGAQCAGRDEHRGEGGKKIRIGDMVSPEAVR